MQRAKLISYSKGISILGIMLYHLISCYLARHPIIAKGVSFGGAGVHVFILCSGFGLMYSNIRRPLNFISFIRKRFFKVYVPYIVVVIIAFLLPNVYSGFNKTMALLSHIFLFKMFIPAYTATFGFQFWYISTIIQFYLFFTVLVMLFQKIGARNFFIMSCLISFSWAVLISLLGLTEVRVWNSFFLQYLWEFALGMVLAAEYAREGKLRLETMSMPKLIMVTLISFVIYSVLSLIGGFLKAFNDPFSLIAFGGICLILYRCNFLPGFVHFTSGISYEIYLLHVLIFKLYFEVFSLPVPLLLTALISVATTYLLSWLYHLFILKISSAKKAPEKT